MSGNSQPHSSQPAVPLWSNLGIISGIIVRELKKKTTKAQAGNKWSNILPKSSQSRKKPPGYSILTVPVEGAQRSMSMIIITIG